jgi:hypothetical protein
VEQFQTRHLPLLAPAQPQRPTGALLSPGRSVQVKGLWRDFRACDVFVTQRPRRSVRYGCDLRKRAGSRRPPEGQAFDLAARETGLTVTVQARPPPRMIRDSATPARGPGNMPRPPRAWLMKAEVSARIRCSGTSPLRALTAMSTPVVAAAPKSACSLSRP